MPRRHLPVRPNLRQLKRQAKELLREIRAGDSEALADLRAFHPEPLDPAEAKLNDAQLVLARSYDAPSWPRLALACDLVAAIWRNDLSEVRQLVTKHPNLLHESALVRESNWGPPMSYAANLGRDRIIRFLHGLGAEDQMHALGRALLQGKLGTARLLHDLLGQPTPPRDALEGPAYTLEPKATALVLELGGTVYDEYGQRLAPVDVVLETDSRKPEAKHAILEMYVEHGLALPDTPTMALHRGRLDLLEEHLRRDPGLLGRTFTHEEIYPPEVGCHDEVLATHGTPLAGATLLHMCVDYDEVEIARWLLEQGMDPNAKATVDAEGFGGHTALFATVVSQPAYGVNCWKQRDSATFARMLLDRGADPNVRASLRKQLHPGYDEHTLHEYRDVTPLSWGERFHRREFVSRASMKLIAARGGMP